MNLERQVCQIWSKNKKSHHELFQDIKQMKEIVFLQKEKLLCQAIRKNRKEFYHNFNVKYIAKNKLFWKTLKPLFTFNFLKD